MTMPADQHTDFNNPRSDDDDLRTVSEPGTGAAADTDRGIDDEPGTGGVRDESADEDGTRYGENGAADGDADRSATAGSTAASTTSTSQGTDADGRERLVPQDRADSYGARWDAVKGTFVDEPRKAVAEADKLVGELLDELQALFRNQRQDLEEGLAADETSTEDLRLGLRRYRSFFDRLLSF